MREIKFRAFWVDTLKPVEHFNSEYLIDACNDENFIVHQYTGLKDKNGKEIYEGDIIKSPALPYEVYVIDDFDRFIYWKLEADLSLKENLPTVIGNIFENKDLLK